LDLNYIFLRQQVERSRARSALNRAARSAHEELARRYEDQIELKTAGRIQFSRFRGEAN
jgi:hypothetical protein